jgi:hypothetical protein
LVVAGGASLASPYSMTTKKRNLKCQRPGTAVGVAPLSHPPPLPPTDQEMSPWPADPPPTPSPPPHTALGLPV